MRNRLRKVRSHVSTIARSSSASIDAVSCLPSPDGTSRQETIVPERSTLEMVHEYDAVPEGLFAGFAAAESTQLHPRYPQYYPGGMPWELFYVDLDNGAQLMLSIMAFHDSPDGTLSFTLPEALWLRRKSPRKRKKKKASSRRGSVQLAWTRRLNA